MAKFVVQSNHNDMTRRPDFSLIISIICSLMLSSGLFGCSSHKQTVTAYKAPRHVTIPSGVASESRQLLSEAEKWLGTPYKYGGTHRGKGVDCSGLVMSIYSNALSIKLPRSSAEQASFCRGIDKHHLAVGDLVFFAPRKNGRVNHVGMYIGNGNMIHASTSRGVTISSLSEKYFADNFYGFGRVGKYESLIGKSIKSKAGTPQKKEDKKSNKNNNGKQKSGSVIQESPDIVRQSSAIASNKTIGDESSIPPVTRELLKKNKNGKRSSATNTSSKSVVTTQLPDRTSPDNQIDQKVDSICTAFFD